MTAREAGRPDAVLIAGPTASGKSALALDLARQFDGVVVNADSMQVYDALAVLTARPGEEEMGGVEHVLYGHVPASRAYSVAEWLAEAVAALDEIRSRGKVPILTGGTGLYFKALEEGLSPVPPIDEEVRRVWRKTAREAPETLYPALQSRDPEAAVEIGSRDTQRLVRALEVFDSTGKSLRVWQDEGRKASPLAGLTTQKWLIDIDRAELHRRIEARVERMVEQGALEEVRALVSLGLPPGLAVMQAIGVPQLAAHLAGEIDLETAIERIKAATRQYAKRQMTWFRHQMAPDWQARDA